MGDKRVVVLFRVLQAENLPGDAYLTMRRPAPSWGTKWQNSHKEIAQDEQPGTVPIAIFHLYLPKLPTEPHKSQEITPELKTNKRTRKEEAEPIWR